jgi:hypothetical protein
MEEDERWSTSRAFVSDAQPVNLDQLHGASPRSDRLSLPQGTPQVSPRTDHAPVLDDERVSRSVPETPVWDERRASRGAPGSSLLRWRSDTAAKLITRAWAGVQAGTAPSSGRASRPEVGQRWAALGRFHRLPRNDT